MKKDLHHYSGSHIARALGSGN